nr:hypothetical protein Ade03nite_07560 [Actinoplanes derwentensis]
MTALGLSGLILGAPFLLSGTASAGQPGGDGRQVSFGGGGVFGLSCGSQPSVEAMTVPAGSVVRVVNRTGHAAKLRLDGSPRGTIPADGVAEVVFRRGATPVLLTPVCAFGADEGLPVLVTTAPSAVAEDPDPKPGAPGDGAATIISKSAGKASPSRTAAGSRRTATASRPARTAKKDSRRGARRPAEPAPATSVRTATTAAQPEPRDDVTARLKTRPKPRPGPIAGTGDEAPAFTGMPPGGRAAFLPGTSAGSEAPYQAGVVPPFTETDYVAALGLEPETGGPSDLGSAASVTMVGRIEDGPPVGLLALTAVVCVLGVATAAIRSIVSQRASRTNMA